MKWANCCPLTARATLRLLMVMDGFVHHRLQYAAWGLEQPTSRRHQHPDGGRQPRHQVAKLTAEDQRRVGGAYFGSSVAKSTATPVRGLALHLSLLARRARVPTIFRAT